MPLVAPLALASLLALAAPQDVAERALERESGHLYLRTREPLSLLDAEALARELGGALVSIGSAAEETFLLDNFGAEEAYWIGLEFPRERWASGEPVAFAHWAAGEPGGGTREPFTLMNWGEPGAWVDASGDADTQRFRALIELPSGKAPDAVPDAPAPRAARGVLLCAIQDLAAKDLESSKYPALNALWKASAWTADAGADASGDPLAGLGALLWGVGSARSGLSSAEPARAARDAHENALARVERLAPGVGTVALLDDPLLGGILLDGRVDVRVTDASPRKGGSQAPLADALSRAAPLFVVATWTDLAAVGKDPASESARARALAAIDAELDALLAALRARPAYAQESWWIAVAGLAPRPARKGKPDDDARARTAVPVCVVAPSAPPGPILGEVALSDLAPTALAHLGLAPRASWQLDGRVLALDSAPSFGASLLANGGAEDQPGWFSGAGQAVRGWRTLAPFRVARRAAAEASTDLGQSYFEGANETLARMEQSLDLRALAADVDAGAVRFRLAGRLGTRGNSQASIECALELVGENGKTLGRAVLGPVGQSERREKLGAEKGVPQAGLMELSTEGRVPRRTRSARVVLLASGPSGVALAMADALELVLERD